MGRARLGDFRVHPQFFNCRLDRRIGGRNRNSPRRLHAPLDRHAFAKRRDQCPYCHLDLVRVGPLIYVRRVARYAELTRALSRETRYVPGQAKLDGINDATLSGAIGTADPKFASFQIERRLPDTTKLFDLDRFDSDLDAFSAR